MIARCVLWQYVVAMIIFLNFVIKHGSVGLSDTFVILLNFDESLIQDGTKEHLKKL